MPNRLPPDWLDLPSFALGLFVGIGGVIVIEVTAALLQGRL